MTPRSARSRPGAGSFLVSVGVHAVVLVLAVGVGVAPAVPVQYETFQVELVSPPGQAPTEEPAPEEELVVETPDPEPPAEETPAPVVEERDDPPPEPETRPDPTPPRPDPEPERTPERGGEADDPSADAGEDIDVRLEGLRRDYPRYYQNIITQINRCFRRRPGERHRAVIGFVIRSDGTVSDLEVVRPSGNVEFDYRAMGAVECAGRPGRIGPLPQGYPRDRLPIRFDFEPSS